MIKFSILSRVILSAAALGGGILIVIISLTAANPVLSAETNESEKEFYFGQTILPDHVLYPVLMIADRAKLETVNEHDEVYTRVIYSIRRQEAAQQLLEKDKHAMAYTTLTKSQKYLLQAGNKVIAEKREADLAEYVQKALTAQSATLESVRTQFNPQYYMQINQLIQENNGLVEQLENYKNGN